jgi:hypothetical protein
MNTIMIYLPIVMAIIGLLFMWIKRSGSKTRCWRWEDERDFRLHL